MMQAHEQMVRECAYYLWIDSGRMDGMAHEHWTVAEKTITLAAFDAPMSTGIASDKKVRASKPRQAIKKTATANGTAKSATKVAAKAAPKAAAKGRTLEAKGANKAPAKTAFKASTLSHGATTH